MTANAIPTVSNYPASAETAPAGNASAVVPADVDLTYISRALYIGVAGDLTVIMAGNVEEVTFVGVGAGTVLPIRVTQVKASTTATSIVAMY